MAPLINIITFNLNGHDVTLQCLEPVEIYNYPAMALAKIHAL